MNHHRQGGRAAVLALLTAAVLSAAGVHDAALAAPEATFQAAYATFARASAGDSAAIDAAAEAFDALRRAEPANPVLLAYAGSALTMKARTTLMPWKKMGYAEDGLAQIDKALALLTPAHDAAVQHGVPGALEVRFVAASTFLAVPGFMNRAARGRRLLDDVLASPLFDRAPLPFRGQVWMRAAALAVEQQRPADARRWLDAVITHGAPQAADARTRLKEIGA
ncbi:MAG: hypothetical protein KF788_20145 [Piscinibacter sp.]|nr:hypothetical protein [Piscinibacter sp.]